MKVLLVLCLAIVAHGAPAPYDEEAHEPKPYSYEYKAELEDGGSSSHKETSDGNGKVEGTYTVTDLEGHTRVVVYTADENGFHASIQTNEPGTSNIASADVEIESSADEGAVQYSMGASASADGQAQGATSGRASGQAQGSASGRASGQAQVSASGRGAGQGRGRSSGSSSGGGIISGSVSGSIGGGII